MIKISVIIPVYNVADFLEDCLQSISNQSLKELEIISINDGSTDNSLEILKKFQKKEPRLTIFSQINSGVSAARNLGLEKASGQYLIFVDADDLLHPDFCKNLYKIAQENQSEIVICDYLYQNPLTVALQSQEISVQNFVRKEIVEKFFPAFLEEDIYNSACNKFYLKSFVDKVGARFPIGVKIAEDANFNHQLFSKANTISETDFKGYFYREVIGSATKNAKKHDYLQSNLDIYNTNHHQYFGEDLSSEKIDFLKKKRLRKGLLPLIYIYFNPENGLSLKDRFKKIREILNHSLTQEVFSNPNLAIEKDRYSVAIAKEISKKNILKLYLYTLYSYYRNKK